MKVQVVIVGGGPAGSSTAIALNKKGISNVMVEKTSFPRFHIGESMTGECGASVRALGVEHKMKEFGHPIKYGTRVYGAAGKNSFYVPVMGRNMEGELYDQTTWQVRRAEFDNMLLEEAKNLGTELIDARATGVIRDDMGKVSGITIRKEDGTTEEIHADVVVDASGQNTFLSGAGVTGPKERGNYSKQVALYTHVKGAIRDEGKMKDDTLIFYQKRNHWAWFIPLNEEVVSLGIVTPAEYFKSTGEDRTAFFMRELKELNSEMAKRVENIEVVEDVRATSNYSHHIKEFTGKGYLCVGDSHRFIDPIFSLGMHFAMAEAVMASDHIRDYLSGKTAHLDNPFQEYQDICERGMDVIQDMLDAFWDYPFAFSLYIKDKRYRSNFIDMFAGRVYTTEPSAGLLALRKLNIEGSANKMAESA